MRDIQAGLLVLCGALCACTMKPPPQPRPVGGAGPELFGEGLFSTDAWDFFVAFSPDGERALFGRADDGFSHYTLYETRRAADGGWGEPQVPSFATRGSNADPHFSIDGRTVYFISNRRAAAGADAGTFDVWSAHLDDAGQWEEAVRVPEPVSSASTDEWCPSVARSGNLYFGSARPGTRGGSDLWVSRLVDGVYQAPENLGDAINSASHEVEAWISPDERYLIFAALNRPDGIGGYDLFVSHWRDGRWTRAALLGGGVNTTESDWNHSVSPDGAWLYFTSGRRRPAPDGGRGPGDIYRIRMSALELSPP